MPSKPAGSRRAIWCCLRPWAPAIPSAQICGAGSTKALRETLKRVLPLFALPLLSISLPALAGSPAGNLPLSFEPNQGQTDPQVRFLARAPGYTLFVTSDEAVFA